MKINRRFIAVGAAVVVVAAGGIGVAYAVSGDSEEQASGPEADRAKAAAVKAVGGGTAVSVERGDGGNAAFEVEVKRPDGSQVEVGLDDGLKPLGTESDDDRGESENEGAEDDD